MTFLKSLFPRHGDLLPEDRLIFILSAPRSGSSLIAHVLSHHPRLYYDSEPWLMLAFSQFARLDIRSEAGAWHVNKAVNDFLGSRRGDLLARAARAVYAGKLPAGKTHFLDKTPRYYLIVDELRRYFPHAHFLVLRRSPLDIAASFKSSWGLDLSPDGLGRGADSMLFDAFFGPEIINSLRAEDFARAPCFVDYESFVSDPVAHLRRILTALGLSVRQAHLDRMLRVDGAQIDQARFGDRKIRSTTAVHAQSLESWRTVLSPSEAQLVAAYHGLEGVGASAEERAQACERAEALRDHLRAQLRLRRFQQERAVALGTSLAAGDKRIADAYFSLFGAPKKA